MFLLPSSFKKFHFPFLDYWGICILIMITIHYFIFVRKITLHFFLKYIQHRNLSKLYYFFSAMQLFTESFILLLNSSHKIHMVYCPMQKYIKISLPFFFFFKISAFWTLFNAVFFQQYLNLKHKNYHLLCAKQIPFELVQ